MEARDQGPDHLPHGDGRRLLQADRGRWLGGRRQPRRRGDHRQRRDPELRVEPVQRRREHPLRPAEEEPPDGQRQPQPRSWADWLTRLATWIAPTTLLTALLFFFGYAYTSSLYAFFGIDAGTIGFATQDLLIRSSPALYLPAGVALCGALVGALGYHLATRAAGKGGAGARTVRRACWAVAALVVPLLVLGLLAGFEVFDAGPLGTPLLIGGALLLAVLARMMYVRGTGAPYPLTGERAALGVSVAIIVLCSYWAVGDYAQQKGTADAQDLAHHLYRRPAVVLDTPERLHLGWPGVWETALPDVDQGARFRYRYEGLRLLALSGGRMFLVPRTWTWETGNGLILPFDATVRVAFHPG
ncbi:MULTISPECIES: hypothetical protein [Streptomycetaceae]|uniref:hypothetical protein n=1 Tax=Streptomycetaceae TaxID=2062 RepID=UPI0011611454|nr:hypothetical protein [Streptomyces sp. CB02056]